MPDLTIEYMQECSRMACDDPKRAHQGGCFPYLKSNKYGSYEYGTCKHVCQWHQLISDPPQTEEQREKRTCPKCGAKTNIVRVGV